MALFGKKKIIKEQELQSGKVTDVAVNENTTLPRKVKDYSRVLRQPRITEKATLMSENKVYVFEIDLRATKEDVRRAVIEFYKVTPRKINITRTPSKKVASRQRGVFGRKASGKKAYVYLKMGDTIDIV